MPLNEFERRYHESRSAMAHAMMEAGEHIAAHAQLEHTPEELVNHIDDIMKMLSTARYHADRMRVYERLIATKKRGDANREPR